MTDLGGVVDILASLRGTENLLYDCYDEPQRVKQASARILELWHDCYARLQQIINREQDGSSSWMELWSPVNYYPIQCWKGLIYFHRLQFGTICSDSGIFYQHLREKTFYHFRIFLFSTKHLLPEPGGIPKNLVPDLTGI